MGLSIKTTSGKILASAALVGTAAAVAGLGTYGAFTGSTTVDQDVTAGTVTIGLADPASLSAEVAGLLPGDSVEKIVTLENTGTSDFNTVTLTTALNEGATANPLTSDGTNGLQLTIQACTVAWTVEAAALDTCGGTATVIASSSAILGARDLGNIASIISGGSVFLKITTSLPSAASNDFQGLAATVNFTFTATQRTASVS